MYLFFLDVMVYYKKGGKINARYIFNYIYS